MNYNHHQHHSKSSLFIGDLAIFCTEEDIRRTFSPYGEITEVKIIKSEETSRNLSYGFITFASVESAADALNSLNGQLLCGRPMRYFLIIFLLLLLFSCHFLCPMNHIDFHLLVSDFD